MTHNGVYSLLIAIKKNNNNDQVQYLIEYANKNNIILELNEKDIDGNYSLIWVIKENNNEIVQLLMDYANKNNIVLELNKKENKYEYYPLLLGIYNNNIKMVQKIID